MSPEQAETIIDALDYKEQAYQMRFEREPATRGGKPNPLKVAFRKELDKIADAKLAFRSAKITG